MISVWGVLVRIPRPVEIGLPEKFGEWRPDQEEAIETILRYQKRCTEICAPTGFGKSVVNVAAAILSKKPTCIVTHSKALQTQYMRDFESCGLVDIRGRNNYTCDLKPDDPDFSCEDGYSSRCPYKGTIACPASQAEMRAATSSLVVTNYAKWCMSKKFGQGMQHFQQVIYDECHFMPEALANAMQVVLHYREIEEGLKIDFPTIGTDHVETWKEWAQQARPIALNAMMAAQARITGVPNPKPSWIKHFVHMRSLNRKLATLALCRAQDWVAEEIEEVGWQFDPIRPGRYGESALLFRLPHIVAVSATARPKTMFMSGIGKDAFTFKEFKSDFDPKRCPIYYVPTMRVDSRAKSLDLLWARLDQVVARRRDRNGIIHTVSYQRREDILQRSRFAESMVFNAKGESVSDCLDRFIEAYPGSIFVSPSVEAGYDLPYTAAEWQVLCKIPFEPPSRIVKAREQDDPEYRAYQAMQRMVQAFGRAMRAKDDACENFIFDENLDWFLPRYGHLAPSWFHGFYSKQEVLPQPPKRLEKRCIELSRA